MTYRCPIEGCEWALHLPDAEPNTFVVGLGALELLAHLIGRYGADGRTPHGAEEVAALGLTQLWESAFPTWPRTAERQIERAQVSETVPA